jgi:adenylate cyclase
MSGIIQELNRRNVFRAAIAYLAVSWLIVEVATTILPLYPEAPAWLARSLVSTLFIGLVPTLILSWAYEFTSTGLRREKQVEVKASTRPRMNRIVDFVTGGAVVAAIALFFWTPEAANRVPSVAVLPFANMSADPENEYFSDGLTETLIHMIAQSQAIKVTSRTSVFALKDQELDVREIGDVLGVAHVLEGSVQRSGDQLRITAQLIDTEDGTHIWSKNYDRNASDIFIIQDEIASVVANALTSSLLETSGVIAGVGTDNPSAYDLFLHAVTVRVPGTTDALAEAERFLKEALIIDSGFLNAKTELASVYLEQWYFGFRSQEEALPDILSLTNQVLAERQLDSRAAALHLMTQSEIALIDGEMDVVSGNVEKFLALVDRAPNDIDARVFLARSFMILSDAERELEQLERATIIDPLRADIYWRMSDPQRNMGDIKGALASIHRSLDLNPDQVIPYLALAEISRDDGDTVGYMDNYLKAWRKDPTDVELVARIASHLFALKMVDEGDFYLQHAAAIWPNHPAVQYVELIRAVTLEDDELVIETAKVLIEEFRGGNRMTGWILAVKNVLRSGINLGRGDECLEYILQYAPDFDGRRSDAVGMHVRVSQVLALPELAQLLPTEDLLKLTDDIDEFYVSTGGSATANSRYHIDRLLVHGQLEEAIEVYLSEVFTLPSSKRVADDWRLRNPFRAELAADPRIQAEWQRSNREVEEIRKQVRSFLATLPDNTRASP